jgi:hypothetical protein
VISGTDDRIAFVIETDAKLDGIKSARAEIQGLNADTQKTGVSSVAATRGMNAWSAIQAEATGHVGAHSISIGRLEQSLERFSAEALGVNHTAGLLLATMARFAIGSIETAGVLAGIAAVVAIWDKLTESARKATEEQNKAIESFDKLEHSKHLGPQGETLEALNARVAAAEKARAATLAAIAAANAPATGPASQAVNPFGGGAVGAEIGAAIAKRQSQALGRQLAEDNDRIRTATAERDAILAKSAENTDRTFAGNLASLLSFNEHDQTARRNALALIKAYQNDLAHLGDADVEKRAELIGKIKTLNATFVAEDRRAAELSKAIMEAQLHDAVRIGNAAIQAVNAVLDNNKRAVAQVEAMRIQTLETAASARDVTTPSGALSNLAVIEARRAQREQEISEMGISNDLKLKLQQAADDQELAEVEALNRRIEAEDTRHEQTDDARRQRQQAKEEAAAKKRAAVLLSSLDAYVRGSESLAKMLTRLALEPLIKELEGTAVRQFVRAAASAAALDFAGAARHAGAGALALAGAREVAVLGGLGGSGGGGGNSSAGGGGGTGSTFEPRTGTEGQGSVVFNLYSENPYGTDRIQQVRYLLRRADVLNQPVAIQVAPTSGLRAS